MDVIVGWATLFVHRDVGFFGNAFVHESERRRGLHRALLAARLRDAKSLGSRWLANDVVLGSTSQRQRRARRVSRRRHTRGLRRGPAPGTLTGDTNRTNVGFWRKSHVASCTHSEPLARALTRPPRS